MRHRKQGRKLSRTASHRKATLANLSCALFERKHITTTEAKARETRRVSERLITLAKKQTLHARRLAAEELRHKRIVKILFDEIATHYVDRTGGYTRLIKLGQRAGDGAHMAVLELVGFEMASKKKKAKEIEKETKAGSKKKKRSKGEEVEAEAPIATEEEKKKKTKEKKSKAKDKEKKPEEKKEKKRSDKKKRTSSKKKK